MFDALANKATNFVGNIGPAGLLGTAVAGPIGGLIGHAADQAMGLTAGQLGGFGNNPSKDSSGFDSFGGNSGSQGGHSGSSSGNSGNANSNSNNSNSPNGPDATANADEAGGSNFDNVTNSANVTGSSSGGGPTQQAGTQFIQQFLQNATNPTASPATVNAMASSANELGMPQSLQFPPLPELADLLSGAKGLAATTSNNSVDASANPNGISKFLPVLAASTASKGGQTQSQADQLQQLLKLLSVGGLNVAS